MGIVLANNSTSLLAVDLSEGAGSMSITPGDGVLFPNPATGEYFYCTLIDTDGNMEIVKVTARNTDVFTIARGQEGTTGIAFNAGARVELRITAQSVLDAVTTAVDGLELSDLGITASAADINRIDGLTATSSELNLLDGVTATTAELNILDGVTASASDLNKLTGVTSSVAELNILDGVTASTSEINKLAGLTASTTELNKLSGATMTTAELNKLSGLTATTSELNKMSGVTVTTAEINRLSGVTSNIQTQINSFATFPAGSIIAYGGTSAPAGWLLCDGSAVNRVTYATLFGIIGIAFGAGNGSTTFNIPDGRGRVLAGKDNMGGVAANRLTGTSGGVTGTTLGATGGAETHLLTSSEMPSHSHTITYDRETPDGGSGDNAAWDLRPSGGAYTGTTATTGGGAVHNNVQPTLIVNYIIKT